MPLEAGLYPYTFAAMGQTHWGMAAATYRDRRPGFAALEKKEDCYFVSLSWSSH